MCITFMRLTMNIVFHLELWFREEWEETMYIYIHGTSGHDISPLNPPNSWSKVSRWYLRGKTQGCYRTFTSMAGNTTKVSSVVWLELVVGSKANEYCYFMFHLCYFVQYESKLQDYPLSVTIHKLPAFKSWWLYIERFGACPLLAAIWDSHQFCCVNSYRVSSEFVQLPFGIDINLSPVNSCSISVCPCCLWFSSAPALLQLKYSLYFSLWY